MNSDLFQSYRFFICRLVTSRMSKDSRRLVGPEGSVAYKAYVKDAQHENNRDRREGRGNEEHRKVFLKTNVIGQAKGSAYLEQGGTKVMVGVYGPREVSHRKDFSMKGQLTAELKFAPFACVERRGHQADAEEDELGIILGEALSSTVCLHRYPKSCIEVFVTVLEDDGSVLAAALTASGLALANAGVHMFDLIVGSAVSLGEDNQLRVDPERGEGWGSGVKGELTIGLLPTLDQVVACLAEGRLPQSTLASALASASSTASALLPIVQQTIAENVKKRKLEEAQQ